MYVYISFLQLVLFTHFVAQKYKITRSTFRFKFCPSYVYCGHRDTIMCDVQLIDTNLVKRSIWNVSIHPYREIENNTKTKIRVTELYHSVYPVNIHSPFKLYWIIMCQYGRRDMSLSVRLQFYGFYVEVYCTCAGEPEVVIGIQVRHLC